MAALLEKMRYVYNEWEMGTTRYIGVSGLSRLQKAVLLDMVQTGGGNAPATTPKKALVAMVDEAHCQERAQKRAALKGLITQLESGEIPAGLVDTMVHTLDMAW